MLNNKSNCAFCCLGVLLSVNLSWLINNILVIYGCVTNYLKLSGLQHIFMISKSVGPESGHGIVGFSASGSLTGWSYLKAPAGQDSVPSSPSCGYWQDSVPWVGLRPQCFMRSWQEASLRSLPHGSLYRTSHSMTAGFIRGSKRESRSGGHQEKAC